MGAYDADMLISDALVRHPDAAHVFAAHGLPCPRCMGAESETIRAVAAMHDVDVAELLRALNALEEEGKPS